MKRLALSALILTLVFSGASLGLNRYSNGTGGGLFDDPNTWQNGVPQGNDWFGITNGDVVTVASGDAAYDGNGRPTIGGLLVVEDGGTISVGRVSTGLGTWPGGGIMCSGVFSCDRMGPTAPFTITLQQGIFEIRSTVAANTPDYYIYGGRFLAPSSMTSTTLDGGILDGRHGQAYTGNGLFWNSGTIVNKNPNSNTDRGRMNNQFKVNCILDLCDQMYTNKYVVMNWGSVPFTWTTGGVVQIDVYSSNSNDCDRLTTTSGGSVIDSNVVFQIGDAGGLPGVFNDYAGKTYQVIVAGSYDNVTPTVPSVVTWNIGGSDRQVGLINNISSDGTVQVIPEPFGGLAAVVLAALLRRRTK